MAESQIMMVSGIKKDIDFMRMFAEIAGNYGMEVILEPLGPMYSNYINTLPEAVRIIHEVRFKLFYCFQTDKPSVIHLF